MMCLAAVFCVGCLFHVSLLDSFDTNSLQVDLIIESVIRGEFPGRVEHLYVLERLLMSSSMAL